MAFRAIVPAMIKLLINSCFCKDWSSSAVEGRLTAVVQRTTGQISNRNQNSVVLRHCRDVVDAQSRAIEREEND